MRGAPAQSTIVVSSNVLSVASAALAPLQLLAQQLEVTSRRSFDEFETALRSAHADDVALLERIAGLAIVGHEDLIEVALELRPHLDHFTPGDDDRPVGQR